MTTNLTHQEMLIELINLEAILNLPKGTELYISDIHANFLPLTIFLERLLEI